MKNILILLILHLSLFAVNNAEGTLNDTAKEAQIQALYIKVSGIPENATKTITQLKDIEENIQEDKKTKEMYGVIKAFSDSIVTLLNGKNYQNIEKQNSRELQKMQGEIAIYFEQLKQWEELLKSDIEIYDKNRQELSNHSVLWKQTQVNAIEKDAPKKILENVSLVIADINTLSAKLKVKYDKALTSSQIVTTKVSDFNNLNANLKENVLIARNKMFSQNKTPLFELMSKKNFSFSKFFSVVKNTIVEKFYEIINYFQIDSELLYIFTIITAINMFFIIYTNYLYKNRKLFVYDESYAKKEFYFIVRPFSTFFILMSLSIIAVYSDRPLSLTEMLLILVFIPIIRILQTVIKKEYYNYIYLFLFLYLMFFIEENSFDCELESRMFLLLLNIALLIYTVFSTIKKVFDSVHNKFFAKVGNYTLALFSLFLFIGLFANINGSVLLSIRIIDGVFTTIYASIVFYTIYIILTGYIVILLRRRISTASNLLDKYSNHIENTAKVLVKIWMFVWWLIVLVKFLGVYTHIISAKNSILALSWKISDATISVQSIFDFSFIVFSTWFLARFIKILLEVELFSRFRFPRGVPTAILTTMNYTIVITGTIIAFSSLGVTTQQFALVFGALGVGIGFGLRNIIANFVSGIIMVFERPVQIGDTIVVDGTMGDVLSIGARSSTLKTFDGAEVIIPNADFIAKEIVNWTLSDEHRRKTFEFKVGLDNDVEKILQIIRDVALSNQDVLKDPEPLATFQGFGEYYMEFKLYFWLSQNLLAAQSDIAISIYKALKEEKIDMPIPRTYLQNEVK